MNKLAFDIGGGVAADNAPVVRAKGFNVAKARRMAMAAA